MDKPYVLLNDSRNNYFVGYLEILDGMNATISEAKTIMFRNNVDEIDCILNAKLYAGDTGLYYNLGKVTFCNTKMIFYLNDNIKQFIDQFKEIKK